MNKNGLSIIIITFNRKSELSKTLESLNKMIFNIDYEIIILDQNSSDGTEELFKKPIKNLKYLKLDKNLGVAGGRNRGVSLAQYEYMIFLDDDAHFEDKNAFHKIYKFMQENDEVNLFAFQIKNLDNEFYNWPYPKRFKKKADKIFEANKYIGCGHAIKKSFFDSVQGYSEVLFFWGEETELILKSFSKTGRGVLYNGNIKIIHRVREYGRTRDSNRFYYQVRNRLYLIKNMFPKIAFIFYFYYRIGYLIKAIKNCWLIEYKSAIKDLNKMSIDRKNVISFTNLIKYLFIYL